MFGHKAFQPVLDMIIDLAEAAAKEPFDLPEENPAADAPYCASSEGGWRRPACRTPIRSRTSSSVRTRSRQVKQAALATIEEEELDAASPASSSRRSRATSCAAPS
jgi:polyribonucleotide nucleotidyltransferase